MLGELMVFGGILSIVLWLVVTAGVLYLYFKWAPDYFEEVGGGERPWLQDLGNWYHVSTNADDWMVAASQQGTALADEGLGVVKSIPGGDSVVGAVGGPTPPPTSPGAAPASGNV